MKIFGHILITVGTLALACVASAEEKTLVITGRVVEVYTVAIVVKSGKGRLDIVTPYATKYTGKPKVGDTVRVYYTRADHARFDPDGEAAKIEVITAGDSKK